MNGKKSNNLQIISIVLLISASLVITSCSGTKQFVTEQPTEQAEAYMDITVMTYNIHAGTGVKENRLPAAEAMEKMAAIIKEHNPDILLVQEIDKGANRSQYMDEVSWIKENLGYKYGEMSPAIVDGAWNFGVAIFTSEDFMNKSIKMPLYKPDYSKSHPEYPAYYAEQRTLFHVMQDVPAGNSTSQQMNIYCTHLGLTADQRKKQIEEIDKYIESNDPGIPVIIGGDFNTTPDAGEMKPFNDNLKNVFDELGVPKKERLTFPVGDAPKKEIDCIYVSKDIKVREAYVIRDTSLASDHNPVVAKLSVPVKRK